MCIYILLYRTNIVVSYIQTKGDKRKLNIQFLRPFHFSSATLIYSIENHYKPVPHSLNIDTATATIQLRLDSIKKKIQLFCGFSFKKKLCIINFIYSAVCPNMYNIWCKKKIPNMYVLKTSILSNVVLILRYFTHFQYLIYRYYSMNGLKRTLLDLLWKHIIISSLVLYRVCTWLHLERHG